MFKGTSNIYEYTNSEIIEVNLKYWLDNSFIGIGAYSYYSGNMVPIENHFYQKGQVWKSPYDNLAWEQTNEVYVNGYPSGNINYFNGSVILDSPISVKSDVTYNFCVKRYNIYTASETDWFNEIETYDINQPYGSGVNSRMKLPAIVCETVAKSFRPYQLGLGQYSDNTVVFRVFANTRSEANRVADIISEQNEKTIYLFDCQKLKEDNLFPLTVNGYLNSGYLTYEQLITPKEDGGYRWRKFTLRKGYKQECDRLKNNVYHVSVRFNGELVLTDI